MTNEEQGKKMGLIITKAWTDEAFKQRLLTDATAVLKEEGVTVPEGVKVKVVENNEKLFHFVIPHKETVKELNETELSNLFVGGSAPTGLAAEAAQAIAKVIRDLAAGR